MKIYITGHRNPDMDAVCSAYAYAVLKNRLDKKNEYVPVMLGPGNKTTRRIFKELGLDLPMYLHDVRPRVSAVTKTSEYTLKSTSPVYDLMRIFKTQKPSVVPVIDDGEFKGLLSTDDMNAFFLRESGQKDRMSYVLNEDNIESIIEGTYIKRSDAAGNIVAPYMVGAMEYDVFKRRLMRLSRKPVLVVGFRKKHIEAAIEYGVPGIILTGVEDGSELEEVDFSSFKGFVYVSAFDTAETLMLLRLSTPVSEIMHKEQPEERLDADMLFDDAKKTLMESGLRGMSVYENGNWIGYVTRRCFLDKPKQKMILMDHNEGDQSVPGIEEAEIIEIIDHHRLAAPQTRNPIYICSEPVGSTCTIVFEQFKKWGVVIDPVTARVLLSGMVSDTVMLKSPTTTDIDRHIIERLCRIADIEDFNAFCLNIFADSSGLSSMDPKTVIEGDLKSYTECGVKFAIGQVEVSNLGEVPRCKDKYVEALTAETEAHGLDWAMLLVTDVMTECSDLLLTDFPANDKLAYEKLSDCCYRLPGVLSRKKQLLPEILRVLDDN